jgi:hypothetical protein
VTTLGPKLADRDFEGTIWLLGKAQSCCRE